MYSHREKLNSVDESITLATELMPCSTIQSSFNTLMEKTDMEVYRTTCWYRILEKARTLAIIDRVPLIENKLLVLAKMVCSRNVNVVLICERKFNSYYSVTILQLHEGWNNRLFLECNRESGICHSLLMGRETFHRYAEIYRCSSFQVYHVRLTDFEYLKKDSLLLRCYKNYRTRQIVLLCFCLLHKYNNTFPSDLLRSIALFI